MNRSVQEQENLYNLDFFKSLLDKHNIKNEFKDISREDGFPCKYVVFHFPVARSYDEIRVYEDDNIDSISNSNILKYRGISNYEAIWSSELNCIECQLQNPRSIPSSRFLMKSISKYFETKEDVIEDSNIREPINCTIYSSDTANVSIGYSSKEFAILTGFKEGRRITLDVEKFRYRVTLKIENINVKTEEEARNYLEKISNTLFYQIDLLYNLTLILSPRSISRDERIRRQFRRVDRQDFELRKISLEYEYDKIPLSLYWFAQSSTSSPIFMYFALYQVLEYYFPIYATMNVKNKIQNLIKDPRFNINKDSDIVRLLNLMKSNNVNSIGDEREQLVITLRNITSGEEILKFINENEYLEDYYKGKDSLILSDTKARLTDNNRIIDDIAERIYDIRCRIVHNKASEKKILPMSKDLNYLEHEIEILKFVARKVIVANSRQFVFH